MQSRAKHPARMDVQMENIAMIIMSAEMVRFIVFSSSNNKILSVTCGSNADCVGIPDRSVCKQESKKYAKTYAGQTCQPPGECKCADNEFCNLEDKCGKPSMERGKLQSPF